MVKSKNNQEIEEHEMILVDKKTIYTLLTVVILLSIGAWAYPRLYAEKQKSNPEKNLPASIPSIVPSVSAEEIGNMFLCPCCGSPITKGCCGMAKERMAYVEAQVEAGLNKTEIVMNMVKKHGLTALMENEREKFKTELEKNAPQDRPKIVITPTSYNFGDVSVAKGEVSASMDITNEGTKDLIINRIETSCGCTSASIIVDGEEGPRFTMPGHGGQPQGWSASIPPGGKAQLKVYYDPNVHKKMRGKGTRTIDVSSNDPIDISKQVRIDFNQID